MPGLLVPWTALPRNHHPSSRPVPSRVVPGPRPSLFSLACRLFLFLHSLPSPWLRLTSPTSTPMRLASPELHRVASRTIFLFNLLDLRLSEARGLGFPLAFACT